MKPIEDLKRQPKTVKQLYKSPKRWHQGSYGLSEDGSEVHFKLELSYKRPTRFCLTGAIFFIYNKSGRKNEMVDKLFGAIKKKYKNKFHSIPDFNDAKGRTFEEIMEVVELAKI